MNRHAVLALALLGACEATSGRKATHTQQRTRIEEVRQGDVRDRVLVMGTLQATGSAELRVPRTPTWELPIRWMAEDGTTLKKGDRALEFDTASFVQNLAQNRLQYLDAVMVFHSAQDLSALELAQKEFQLKTQRLLLAKAKVQASVPADLLAARVAQERQLELKRAEAAVTKAERELASAKAAGALDRQVKQIELDKARMQIEDAERSISELTIPAPRDGLVVIGEHPWMGRKFQNGDSVQPGWTIVSLPDQGAGMEVRAELSDVDDGRVSIAMTGSCTLDAYPGEPLPCAVRSLMPVASSKGPQSLRRGFAIVLSLDKVDRERMRPGMAVKVELGRPPLAGGLVVPRGAVRFAGDSVTVRLAAGDVRSVELGPCDAQVCSVTKGLVAGDRVVVGEPP